MLRWVSPGVPSRCRLSAVNQRRRGRGGLLQRQGLLQRDAGADGGEQGGSRGQQPAEVRSTQSTTLVQVEIDMSHVTCTHIECGM